MEELIRITLLNDFIYCPVSIYFHNLYGSMDTMIYQGSKQFDGKAAHKTVDAQSASTSKNIVTGLDVFSEKYGLVGKIDYYDLGSRTLVERKKKIKTVYDGYIFQLYGQYFSMIEMGYKVDRLELYSMDDNKKYKVLLPEDDSEMLLKFEKVIEDINAFDIEKFSQRNRDKCLNCIYEPACDRSLI